MHDPPVPAQRVPEDEAVQQHRLSQTTRSPGCQRWRIDEFRPCRVFEKLGKEGGAFGLWESDNVRRVIAEIQDLRPVSGCVRTSG